LALTCKFSKCEFGEYSKTLVFTKLASFGLGRLDHFMHTVKPVYNNQPWDLKIVVVMLRVVWKRSVVHKLWTGCYGYRLAVVDGWLLFGGVVRTGLAVHKYLLYIKLPSLCTFLNSRMGEYLSKFGEYCTSSKPLFLMQQRLKQTKLFVMLTFFIRKMNLNKKMFFFIKSTFIEFFIWFYIQERVR
jgi:hypothetical protein